MDEREAAPDQVPADEAAEAETGVPPEASFAERGTFEGAYGEGSAEAWQDEQAAQRADHPNPPRASGMGGSDTAYAPDTGFAPDPPLEADDTEQ